MVLNSHNYACYCLIVLFMDGPLEKEGVGGGGGMEWKIDRKKKYAEP